MQKVDNPKFEAKVIDTLKTVAMPASVDYVAYNLGLSWITARALLLSMALKGQIQATKTTKSYVFSLKPERRDSDDQH